MRKALTVAASDSGGACGIQADIKTFSALGVFATSVITSVTAQNSVEMAETFDLPTAVRQAKQYMQGAFGAGFAVGQGKGVVHHFHRAQITEPYAQEA